MLNTSLQPRKPTRFETKVSLSVSKTYKRFCMAFQLEQSEENFLKVDSVFGDLDNEKEAIETL